MEMAVPAERLQTTTKKEKKEGRIYVIYLFIE